ncbi:2-amino-4-hydroxy-6-hydroxymethyldihydropteridine diphosphokinase [Candidatus Woesearchaeota archaeon]|nr:2-amino-4-hydroxy-6-hydroxymethyldihydropteridine diphosphokinase [Candidatus Woesearchaeota archaeon]
MAIAYLSLGTNDGNLKKHIDEAISHISRHCKILKKSSLYRAQPKDEGAPHFINCVLKIHTDFNPYKLLEFVQSIEKQLRQQKLLFLRSHKTIDIDILFYDDLILVDEKIVIPHPNLHKRNHILVPFAEIEPDFVHPLHNKKISSYELDDKMVLRIQAL